MIHNSRKHAATARVNATAPRTGTHVIASYQWNGNRRWVMSGNLYSTEPGRPLPGLNVYVRQPLPRIALLPWRMEATADLRNMLAQGYLPLTMAERPAPAARRNCPAASGAASASSSNCASTPTTPTPISIRSPIWNPSSSAIVSRSRSSSDRRSPRRTTSAGIIAPIDSFSADRRICGVQVRELADVSRAAGLGLPVDLLNSSPARAGNRAPIPRPHAHHRPPRPSRDRAHGRGILNAPPRTRTSTAS